MLVVVDNIKVQSLFKNLGGKIEKEGNMPAQMKTDEEKEAAEHEVRRFLLNYLGWMANPNTSVLGCSHPRF